jgi:hypothetical protein
MLQIMQAAMSFIFFFIFTRKKKISLPETTEPVAIDDYYLSDEYLMSESIEERYHYIFETDIAAEIYESSMKYWFDSRKKEINDISDRKGFSSYKIILEYFKSNFELDSWVLDNRARKAESESLDENDADKINFIKDDIRLDYLNKKTILRLMVLDKIKKNKEFGIIKDDDIIELERKTNKGILKESKEKIIITAKRLSKLYDSEKDEQLKKIEELKKEELNDCEKDLVSLSEAY